MVFYLAFDGVDKLGFTAGHKPELSAKVNYNGNATYTNFGFPSLMSIFGGTRKFVKQKMWGGMHKFMTSGRSEGRCRLGEINFDPPS